LIKKYPLSGNSIQAKGKKRQRGLSAVTDGGDWGATDLSQKKKTGESSCPYTLKKREKRKALW